MKRFLLLSFAALALGFTGLGQKRAFTIADLYALKTVEDPQFSPNGKWIAVVVRNDDLATGKSNAEVYVISTDGTVVRQLTNNPAPDVSPRWSPDGKSLLFLSSRKNGQQVWQLPVDGGEPHQLTNLSTGVNEAVWAPDGRSIALSTDIFPDCGTDDACNKKVTESLTKGPLQAYMADSLLYRHWDSWKEGKRTHVFLFDPEKTSYTDLTPGNHDSPAFSLGEKGFAFAPEGAEICFVSNRAGQEAETTNKDLWTVATTGGAPTNLTSGNTAYDGDPAYSPDGRYIAYRTQTIPGYEADRFQLMLFDRKTKRTFPLTPNFDNWVTDCQWSPDSRAVYFTAAVQGHTPLYRVDIATRKIMLIIDPKSIDAYSVSPNGQTIAMIRRSVGEPRELWTCDASGGGLRRLTTFNKTVADSVDIRPCEEMWIPSPTGKKIHTFIVKPHDFDPSKRYPLILNVHGGPQMQWADAFRGDWQVYPGAGYVVAFPNPHGSTGYGQEFTAAISRDWGGKVYEDVLAVTDSLARLPWVDSARMGAMGWSYGGYMMMWLEGHTDRFKAIVSMMGVYNLAAMHGTTEELWFPEYDLGGTPWDSKLYEQWSPNRFVKNFRTPCLVITGERDYRVPYTQSLEFFTALQKMRVPSRLIVFKNDGHWPSGVRSMPFYYNAHLDWFHAYLGGNPAPYDMTKMLRNQIFKWE